MRSDPDLAVRPTKPAVDARNVWVAGHRGMVGSALLRRLARSGYRVSTCSRNEVDLTRQTETEAYLKRERPDVVIVAAALVGGILHNANYPADFLFQNLMIGANVIEASRRAGVAQLLYIGSSCMYPREAPQPMQERHLLTGSLEATNEAYAIAKIASLKMVEFYNKQYGVKFFSVIPPNI